MRKVYNKWKIITERIGNFQATVLFSFLYFLLITPLGLATSLFKDFLNKKTTPSWEEFSEELSDIDSLRRS